MIRVREVEDRDIPLLAEFLPSGFPDTTEKFWLSLFDFWWTSNPAYSVQMPRGWVLDNDGSIAGFIGSIPVRFRAGGEVLIASASNSWYTDPAFRGINSLRLFSEYLKQRYAALFLFKEEDDDPLVNILSRFRFERYVLPPSQTEYVYILDRKKINCVIRSFLFNNSIPRLSSLREYARRLGYIVLALLFQRSIPPSGPYTCSLCTACDESFPALWEKNLAPSDITLSRDTETLNWLYFASGRTNERVVIQCRRKADNTLEGYMVFDVIQRLPNMNNLRLVDMCIGDDDPRILESLTACAIRTGRQHDAALLILWADDGRSEEYLRSAIMMRRTAQYPRYFRFADLARWHPETDRVRLPVIYPPQ